MSKHYIPNEGKQSPEQYAEEIKKHKEAYHSVEHLKTLKEQTPKSGKAVKNYTYINELE